MNYSTLIKNTLKYWWSNKNLTLFLFLSTLISAFATNFYNAYNDEGNVSFTVVVIIAILAALVGFGINLYFGLVAENGIIALYDSEKAKAGGLSLKEIHQAGRKAWVKLILLNLLNWLVNFTLTLPLVVMLLIIFAATIGGGFSLMSISSSSSEAYSQMFGTIFGTYAVLGILMCCYVLFLFIAQIFISTIKTFSHIIIVRENMGVFDAIKAGYRFSLKNLGLIIVNILLMGLLLIIPVMILIAIAIGFVVIFTGINLNETMNGTLLALLLAVAVFIYTLIVNLLSSAISIFELSWWVQVYEEKKLS